MSCCCHNGSVTIKCECSGSGQPSPHGTGGAPSQGDSSPPPEPRCRTAIVRFQSVLVTNSGAVFDLAPEPWDLSLEVNGRAATIATLQALDNESFSIGAGGEVTVPLDTSTVLRVQSSGRFNRGRPDL